MKQRKIILTGVGSDCELFLQDVETNEIVSAEGFVKGTKEHPFVFDPDNKYFATSLDNVAAEVSIPPATSAEGFYLYLQKSINFVNETIPKNLKCVAFPAVNLDKKYLNTPNALLFGCEADLNAYEQDVNPKPEASDKTLRSAGGHLHVGYVGAANCFPLNECDKDIIESDRERQTIVKALDLFIGVPSVILEPDNKRKELYGKAGAYRPKEYGLEYRTVSNFYLVSERLTKLMYSNVVAALDWLNGGGKLTNDIALFVRDTINNNDKEQAEYLINEFKIAI